MSKVVSGIQQVGIGVSDVHEAWKWYRRNLGFDVPVFEEAAEAALMTRYTGNEVQSRHAILALNLQGGGGFEIWQYTSRTPQAANFEIQVGDLGVNVCRVKVPDITIAYEDLRRKGVEVMGEVSSDPAGNKHFFLKDPYGNLFEIAQQQGGWLNENGKPFGGVGGVTIGVSDIEQSKKLYQDILGYSMEVYDAEGEFDDFKVLPGGQGRFRRVKLALQEPLKGRFAPLFGPTNIELIQALDRAPNKPFEGRYWGDLGYIHVCFDIVGMEDLKAECEAAGFPFTVNSDNSFDMGEAAGHFSYIEDPDGTLIEFVETHKIPIAQKWNWYLDLRKKPREKHLPKWILKAMGMMRVKD